MRQENNEIRAFPGKSYDGDGDEVVNYGMSLRDWFAGKAMQGLISSEPNSFNTAIMARDAYIIADCMIEEREK